MTIAAVPLGMFRTTDAIGRPSRELSAFDRATDWLNSPRLTAASLQGKVVLVDFCTYTCINWLRTLPYVRAWAHKYTQGFVVIGVHTPEFAFERNLDNVRRAVKEKIIQRLLRETGGVGVGEGTVSIDAASVEAPADWDNLKLIRQPKPIGDRQFEIEFLDPGVEAFAFTFG